MFKTVTVAVFSFVSIAFAILETALAEVVPAGENLLPNGGFEEGEDSGKGVPEGWRPSGAFKDIEYRWCRDEGREGSRCIFVKNAAERAGLAHVRIPIDPVRVYFLSGWVRTEGLPDGKVFIRVAIGGEGIQTRHHIIRVPASPEWKPFTTAVRDLDPKAAVAVVMIQIRENASGSAWVDDVYFGEGKVLPFKSPYPVPKLSGSRPEKTFKGTGFYRVEKVDGVWWIVKPDGTLFWSTGPCTAGMANPVMASKLNISRSNRPLLKKFVVQSMERIRTWGFNSLGAWSTLDMWGFDILEWNRKQEKAGKGLLPYFVSWNCCNAGHSDRDAIRKGLFLVDLDGKTQGGDKAQGHRMCDPYNPAWKTALEKSVARKIKRWKSDPNLIGHFTDNEIAIYGLYRYLWSPHALGAFVERLKRTYLTAADLNEAWSSGRHKFSYEKISSEALRRDPPTPHKGSDTWLEDIQGFERDLVETYVRTVVGTFRKYDPNHMLLGNRWGTMDTDVLPYLKHFLPLFKSFDICAANLYPHPEGCRQVGDFNYRKQLEWIRALNRLTGRPVLIGEFGTAARDSGVAVQRWAPRTLDTDTQRGESYKKMIHTWYNLPFVVGAHWFKWSNGYGYGGNTGKDPRSCGLIDDCNLPYTCIVKAAIEAHKAIGKAGRRADFKIGDLPWPEKE